MVAFNKFDIFTGDMASGFHNLLAADDVVKVALSNTAPVAGNTIFANITEIGAGNGYTAGGDDTQNDVSASGGIASVTGVDVVWTAGGGTIGPFRYVVNYNDTQTSPVDPLINWWDFGSAVTLQIGESFTVDFGSSMFTIT